MEGCSGRRRGGPREEQQVPQPDASRLRWQVLFVIALAVGFAMRGNLLWTPIAAVAAFLFTKVAPLPRLPYSKNSTFDSPINGATAVAKQISFASGHPGAPQRRGASSKGESAGGSQVWGIPPPIPSCHLRMGVG